MTPARLDDTYEPSDYARGLADGRKIANEHYEKYHVGVEGSDDGKKGHTPGPWEVVVSPSNRRVLEIRGPGNEAICSTHIWAPEHQSEIHANARLIKHSPNLLEALYKITNEDVGPHDGSAQEILIACRRIASEAIAQVKGEL